MAEGEMACVAPSILMGSKMNKADIDGNLRKDRKNRNIEGRSHGKGIPE